MLVQQTNDVKTYGFFSSLPVAILGWADPACVEACLESAVIALGHSERVSGSAPHTNEAS